MIYETQLPGDASSVARARRFMASVLKDARQHTSEECALIVSELVSNAVRHANTDVVLRVEERRGAIHLEIEDNGPGEPEIKSPPVTELSGRGLKIVDALANDWGVRRTDQSAKVVWATVAVSGRRAVGLGRWARTIRPALIRGRGTSEKRRGLTRFGPPVPRHALRALTA